MSAQEFPSTYAEDLQELLERQMFSDAFLRCGGQSFPSHRFILAASSSLFLRVLSEHGAASVGLEASAAAFLTPTRSSSEASLVSGSIEYWKNNLLWRK